MNLEFFPAIEDALKQVDQRINQVISPNAFGLLKDMADEHLKSGGKKIRGRIALVLATVFDIPLEKVLGWTAACEMFHNGTLIHDDLQDGDSVRRGQPTIWKTFGAAQAINLGDFFMLAAPQAFAFDDLTVQQRLTLLQLYSQMSSQVIQGQSLEFELKSSENLFPLTNEYRHCISLKTAALFAKLAKGIGIISELSHPECCELESAFENLGLMFQLQDDVLDLFGEKGRDQIGCDLKEGKISALVVGLVEKNPDFNDWLRDVLNKDREQTSSEDILLFKNRVEEFGVLQSLADDMGKMQSSIFSISLLNSKPLLRDALASLIEVVLNPIRHLPEMTFNRLS